MTQFQPFLPQRTGILVTATLFFWCNVLEGIGQSQNLPLRELNKLPKPCFAEATEQSPPSVSQTELSTPSLWLDKDIYDDVIQQQANSEVKNQGNVDTVDTEAEEKIEAQLAEHKSKKQSPVDFIEADNQLLETWSVEDQSSVWLSPTSFADQLVTLVVNRQLWQAERYIGQYVFINRFGTTAREHDYSIRVCSDQGEFLGYYTCKFETNPLKCEIMLRSEGFRLRDFRLFEVSSPESE